MLVTDLLMPSSAWKDCLQNDLLRVETDSSKKTGDGWNKEANS